MSLTLADLRAKFPPGALAWVEADPREWPALRAFGVRALREYDSEQPREPAGSEKGGQFASSGQKAIRGGAGWISPEGALHELDPTSSHEQLAKRLKVPYDADRTWEAGWVRVGTMAGWHYVDVGADNHPARAAAARWLAGRQVGLPTAIALNRRGEPEEVHRFDFPHAAAAFLLGAKESARESATMDAKAGRLAWADIPDADKLAPGVVKLRKAGPEEYRCEYCVHWMGKRDPEDEALWRCEQVRGWGDGERSGRGCAVARTGVADRNDETLEPVRPEMTCDVYATHPPRDYYLALYAGEPWAEKAFKTGVVQRENGAAREAFDPSQPRDEAGRWTDVGFSGAAYHGSPSAQVFKQLKLNVNGVAFLTPDKKAAGFHVGKGEGRGGLYVADVKIERPLVVVDTLEDDNPKETAARVAAAQERFPRAPVVAAFYDGVTADREFIQKTKAAGHDAIVSGDGRSIAVFRPVPLRLLYYGRPQREAFDPAKHPRGAKGSPEGGQFVVTGSPASVKADKGPRVFAGEPVVLKTPLSKQETGRVAEAVVVGWLKAQGHDDAAFVKPRGRNNFPVDAVYDHTVVEVKGGLVSNRADAQKWRLTIGEPSDEEKAWLARASPAKKAEYNAAKSKDIVARKEAAVKEVEERTGLKITRRETVTVILNPDSGRADVHRFEGWHQVIRWRSDEAKKAFAGTVKYAGA